MRIKGKLVSLRIKRLRCASDFIRMFQKESIDFELLVLRVPSERVIVLKLYKYETSGRRFKFAHPSSGSEVHDDMMWSLLLALWAEHTCYPA